MPVSVALAVCGMGGTDAVSGRKRCRPASSSALACRSDAAIAASAMADAAATCAAVDVADDEGKHEIEVDAAAGLGVANGDRKGVTLPT